MNKIQIRVWPGYMQEPLFINEGEYFRLFYDYEEKLLISDKLKEKIREWDEQYQATLNHDDPMASDFKTPEDEHRHQEEGKCLAKELQKELGDGYTVEYKK